MDPEESIRLLQQVGPLSHPCDFDLLVFFIRHPRCLLSSEALAAFLGYEPKVLAEALETLLTAELIARTQTSAHAARFYVLQANPDTDPWLIPLRNAASTRAGRLALRGAVSRTGGPRHAATPENGKLGPRRLDDRVHPVEPRAQAR